MTNPILRFKQRADRLLTGALTKQLFHPVVFFSTLSLAYVFRLLGTPQYSASEISPFYLDVAVAHVFLWLWLLSVTRPLMQRFPNRLYLVGLSVLVGGLFRGVVMHLLIITQNPLTLDLLGHRLTVGVTVVATSLLVISFSSRRLRDRYERLEQIRGLQLEADADLRKTQDQMPSWRVKLTGSVRNRLVRELVRLRELPTDQVSSGLKRWIDKSIRPLSRELGNPVTSPSWNLPKSGPTRFPSWSVLNHLVRETISFEWRVAYVFAPLLVQVMNLPTALLIQDRVSATLLLPGFLALTIPFHWVANQLHVRFLKGFAPWLRLVSLLVILLLASLPGSFLVLSLAGLESTRAGGVLPEAILMAFGISAMSVVVSGSRAADRAMQADFQKLDATVAQLRRKLARHHAVMWSSQKALAQLLHGPLQATATAGAIQLDLADGKTARRKIAGNTIRELEKLVEQISEEGLSKLQASDELLSAFALWEGVCHLSIHVDAKAELALQQDPIALRTVIDLTQDATSNAVAHGAATEVSIELRLDNRGDVNVVVRNNGRPLPDVMTPGFGARQRDSLTTSWQLRTVGSQVELNFTVPVETVYVGIADPFAK